MTELRLGRISERVMVAGSGCILVGVVAAADGNVRRSVVNVLSGEVSGEFSMMTSKLNRLGQFLIETVGFQGSENGLLIVFALAALGLLTFMLRM